MQLVEYVNSLFEQGLSGEEVIAKTQEWKKKNQPKVEEEVVEEVKIDPVVEEKTDVSAPGKDNVASENSTSGSGQSKSLFQESDWLKSYKKQQKQKTQNIKNIATKYFIIKFQLYLLHHQILLVFPTLD